MAVITIDNFPDELYAKLRRRAEQNGRVIRDEIVEAAQKLVSAPGADLTPAQKLALADRIRGSTAGTWLDDEFIRRAREEGRL